MLIGLDFDNTIVNYDTLFYRIAREMDVVPVDTPANKIAIRDYLRGVGQEEIWTLMQGAVYGARINEAVAYPGVIEFLVWAEHAGHNFVIISHKTRYPFLGPKYDLHLSARTWIEQYLRINDRPLISHEQIYLEDTRDEKLSRIRQLCCNVFVDDLPEVLLEPKFPNRTQRVLFDPELNHTKDTIPAGIVVRSWNELFKLLHD